MQRDGAYALLHSARAGEWTSRIFREYAVEVFAQSILTAAWKPMHFLARDKDAACNARFEKQTAVALFLSTRVASPLPLDV